MAGLTLAILKAVLLTLDDDRLRLYLRPGDLREISSESPENPRELLGVGRGLTIRELKFGPKTRGGTMATVDRPLRLETTFSNPAEISQIEWIRDTVGERSIASLLREALMLYGWAVHQVVVGRRVCSFDPAANGFCEFHSPLLERARWARRQTVELSEEGLARMAELIENPPEPTEELRALMRDSE